MVIKGPNTGWHGTYAPAPVLTDALRDAAMKTILEPMVAAMEKEGMPYVGLSLCRPYDYQ